jgi:hypothetical protein
MSEYEDRYPEAYGRREETDREPRPRRFLGLGLPRQVRDIADLPPRESRHAAQLHTERPRRPLVERSPSEICEDVAEQLAASPFVDASGISITVDDGEIRLDGTINSLIAISLARALALNVSGVSRVQVQLRVVQAPKRYVTG